MNFSNFSQICQLRIKSFIRVKTLQKFTSDASLQLRRKVVCNRISFCGWKVCDREISGVESFQLKNLELKKVCNRRKVRDRIILQLRKVLRLKKFVVGEKFVAEKLELKSSFAADVKCEFAVVAIFSWVISPHFDIVIDIVVYSTRDFCVGQIVKMFRIKLFTPTFLTNFFDKCKVAKDYSYFEKFCGWKVASVGLIRLKKIYSGWMKMAKLCEVFPAAKLAFGVVSGLRGRTNFSPQTFPSYKVSQLHFLRNCGK